MENHRERWLIDDGTGENSKQERVKQIREMRRRLYTSNYTGIPVYLMDFGFGGFLGYGRRVSCCVGEEELNRCDR